MKFKLGDKLSLIMPWVLLGDHFPLIAVDMPVFESIWVKSNIY